MGRGAKLRRNGLKTTEWRLHQTGVGRLEMQLQESETRMSVSIVEVATPALDLWRKKCCK